MIPHRHYRKQKPDNVSLAGSVNKKLARIVLPDVDEHLIRVGSLWDTKPTILVFLQHYGSRLGRRQIEELCQHQCALKERGIQVAAIGLGNIASANSFRSAVGMDFPLLVDEKREAYRAAEAKNASASHLLRRSNILAWLRVVAAGIPSQGLTQNPLQLGASFVLGPGEVIRFRHISETFSDLAPVQHLIAALP